METTPSIEFSRHKITRLIVLGIEIGTAQNMIKRLPLTVAEQMVVARILGADASRVTAELKAACAEEIGKPQPGMSEAHG